MSEAILVSCITGVLGLIGSVIVALISANSTKNAVTQKLTVSQAVTDTKLDELTREVRKHNNFAERIPVIEEQIKVANHRIDDLEEFHKQN